MNYYRSIEEHSIIKQPCVEVSDTVCASTPVIGGIDPACEP